MDEGAVCAVSTDAPGIGGWGAIMGECFIQGEWPKTEAHEGVNWKESWVLKRSMDRRRSPNSGKLALARIGNATAALYKNYGAGRSPRLTLLARGAKELEVSLRRTAVALHIAGKHDAVAEALPHFAIWAQGRDQYPDRELRTKWRRVAAVWAWI